VSRFERTGVGWRLGRSHTPRGVELWVPYDRTAGVYGPQGCGKTLDLLIPALLVTLTKLDDLLLTLDRRAAGGRPVAVLDPFGVAPGVPELVWDPVAGCVDSMLAERRATAFTAGTVKGAVAGGSGDDAGGKDGRFYREISDLIGTARIRRTSYSSGRGGWGTTTAGEDVPILRPEEIRQLPQRQALVVAENARPLIAALRRRIDGKDGQALLAARDAARDRVAAARHAEASVADRTRLAVEAARRMALHARQDEPGRADEEDRW